MFTPETLDISSLPSLLLSERSQLPWTPCIYFAIDSQGVVQYIGQSKNLRQRWVQHHRQRELEGMNFVKVAWLHVSEPEMLVTIETALIEWFQPPLNDSAILSNKKKISVYMDKDLKDDLEKLAKVESRSLSNLIELVCKEAVAKAEKEGLI